MRHRPTYTSAQRHQAIRLARDVGVRNASRQLGIGRSTLSTWLMRTERDELPPPAWPQIPKALAYGAPGIDEMRARWTARGSYEPSAPLTGRQLLQRIWPDRTAAA